MKVENDRRLLTSKSTLTYKVSMSFPFRSPRDTVHGIAVFGRILDKIRYHAREGTLPEGYHLGPIEGVRTFDDRVCRFLGVRFQDLTERTLAGGSDEGSLNGASKKEAALMLSKSKFGMDSCTNADGVIRLRPASKHRRTRLVSETELTFAFSLTSWTWKKAGRLNSLAKDSKRFP